MTSRVGKFSTSCFFFFFDWCVTSHIRRIFLSSAKPCACESGETVITDFANHQPAECACRASFPESEQPGSSSQALIIASFHLKRKHTLVRLGLAISQSAPCNQTQLSCNSFPLARLLHVLGSWNPQVRDARVCRGSLFHRGLQVRNDQQDNKR